MGRINFLGTYIDNLSMKEILDKIDVFISIKKPHQLVAVNVAKIVRLQKDMKLAKIVNSCDVVFADGQGVVWGSKFLNCALKERVAGVDLMENIVKKAVDRKYKIYFLGAEQKVIEKLVSVYKIKFPQINIVGWHHGYFKSGSEEKLIVEEIKALQPDILFVGMGTPRKEYWIKDNLGYLAVPVCLGVGGSFDVMAGFIKRAPAWMQKIGLEWSFRFLNEPGRLWKRYLVGNMAFIWLILNQKFKRAIAYILLALFIFSPFQIFNNKEEYNAWFPFYIPWAYCKGSNVDVGFLLDAPAGKHGFVIAKDGHFYFEDGKRAKFWGLNIHSDRGCFPTHEQAEDIAKRLRQLGCNIVRMHFLDNECPGGIIDATYNDSQHLSHSQMEKLDYFIYQLKQNGIYICFDVLGLGARRFKEGDDVPEFDRITKGARGISFFDEHVIGLSKKFAIDFLSHVNLYTGDSYLNEPAIAMIEMTNENTLFQNVLSIQLPDYYKKEMENYHREWLVGKKITKPNGSWHEDRRFLFELQNTYQKKMYEYLRSIGVKAPIGASNMPYDNLILAADSNMDFTDIHPYWDHIYKSNRLHNRPLIKQSCLNPSTIVNVMSKAKVKDRPLIITEWDSMWPNDWRAVDLLTTASYAALNDWDALFLFSYMGGWSLSWDNLENKLYYPTVIFNDPAKMGLFPTCALIFLREDARPALNTYQAWYSLDELFDKSDAYFDRARLAGITYISKIEKNFYKIDDKYSNSPEVKYPDVANLIKNDNKIISDTGEMITDAQNGIFILKTPRTFSFSGFTGNTQRQEFNGIKFSTKSNFATFTITSLDNKDISKSSHLLLTVVGRARNKGQKFTPHLTKRQDDLERDVYVLSTGDKPILAEAIDAEIFLKKDGEHKNIKVFALDEKGLRKSEPLINIVNKEGYSFNVSGDYKTIYYEIAKE